jgi:hypothetical protein
MTMEPQKPGPVNLDRFPNSLKVAYFYFGLLVGTGSALAWIERGGVIGRPYLWSIPELVLAGVGWLMPYWLKRSPSVVKYVIWIPTILLLSTLAKIITIVLFTGL